MTQTFRQIEFAAYGDATRLQLVERSMPKLKEEEVLIEVEAAGVNYADILRRRNTYFMPTPLPYVLGVEAVGTIVKLGAKAAGNDLEQDMRVLAILPYGGGYGEYATALAAYCIPLPKQIDSKAATALFVQGTTAHLMVSQIAGDLEAKTVLVHAAAGGVGSLLVQLCKQAGAKVVATVSSEEKAKFAIQLGADAYVNYTQPEWVGKIIAANEDQKVDVIFEMVGGNIFTQSFACLAPFGKMIVYGAASGEKGMMHSEHFVDESHQLLSFNLAHYMQQHFPAWQASLGAMIEGVARGEIRIQTPKTYALADAAQAHQDIEQRLTTGKVVLIP